jgi:hypothetical protein
MMGANDINILDLRFSKIRKDLLIFNPQLHSVLLVFAWLLDHRHILPRFSAGNTEQREA